MVKATPQSYANDMAVGVVVAIDLHEGETMDEEALKTLVRAAMALNKS